MFNSLDSGINYASQKAYHNVQIEKLYESHTILDLRLFLIKTYVYIECLSQALSSILKNERCKLGEKGNLDSLPTII